MTSCALERSRLGGTFDYASRHDRLKEVELELAQPDVWNSPERAQALGRERAMLEGVVNNLDAIAAAINDAIELLELAESESDESTLEEALFLWDESSADFADCMIGAKHRREGCRATVSFDAKAIKLPMFVAV